MKINTRIWGTMWAEGMIHDSIRELVDIIDREIENPVLLVITPEMRLLDPQLLRQILIGAAILEKLREWESDE